MDFVDWHLMLRIWCAWRWWRWRRAFACLLLGPASRILFQNLLLCALDLVLPHGVDSIVVVDNILGVGQTKGRFLHRGPVVVVGLDLVSFFTSSLALHSLVVPWRRLSIFFSFFIIVRSLVFGTGGLL